MRFATIIVLALCSFAAPVHASPTPGELCESAMNLASAKFAQCRLTAESKNAKAPDAAKLAESRAKCSQKLSAAFDKATLRYGVACPAIESSAAFDAYLEQCSDDTAAAAGGAAFPSGPVAPTLSTGQTTCWDGSGTVIPCAGTGQDGELQRGIAAAYVDNDDGTLSDVNTGLMWEKLSYIDGTVHDAYSTYSWFDAIGVKIATLNAGAGFAGHQDWRLPNRRELESILRLQNSPYALPLADSAFHNNVPPPLDFTPRSNLECSLTAAGRYWTSSSYTNDLQIMAAYWVDFGNGTVNASGKTFTAYVRAVRGGS